MPTTLVSDESILPVAAVSPQELAARCPRVATRYDRLARNYLASLALVSAVVAWT